MNEFDIIKKYFVKLTQGHPGTSGLENDAAVIAISSGNEIVITSDTLNAGTHFLVNEDPANIARKSLRTNLSDLAATGAEPLCYQLCLAFPAQPDSAWLEKFTEALLEDQKKFGIFCSGGDTTSIVGNLSISITALGVVSQGLAVKRDGAKVGDFLVLTGMIGDAVLGLKSIISNKNEEFPGAVSRYRVPIPRNKAACLVRKYAHAAIDISDGLLADIGHICNASAVGAVIELGTNSLYFSDEVRMALDADFISLETILSGGDDYEIALAIDPDHLSDFLLEAKKIDLNPLIIGSFKSNKSEVLVVNEKGENLAFNHKGWKHF